MFNVGDKVKLSAGFLEWCRRKLLDAWLVWSDEVLEVVQVAPNNYDPNYLDIQIKPVGHDCNIKSISIDVKTFRFCRDVDVVPLDLVDGTKFSVADEDRCKKCGAPGKIVLMACICSKCGQIVWGA